MTAWLREFHIALMRRGGRDARIALFIGSLLLGMIVGASIGDPLPPLSTAFGVVVAAFNIYVGVFSGRYVQ